MGQFNIKLRFDKYFNEVDGMLVCYIFLFCSLRHDRGYFPSSDVKACKISSDISRLLLNIVSQEIKI